MISSLSFHSHSLPLDSTPLKLSQLNRTAFSVNENGPLLQAFHSADWATRWAALCFMKHVRVLDKCLEIRQAAQDDPLLADALGDLPPLNPDCRFVSHVLLGMDGVPQAFGRAFRLALVAALNANTNDRLRFCLAVLSAGGLSDEMRLAAFEALVDLKLTDSQKARVGECVPDEGVKKKLLESFEAAGMSSLHLSQNGTEHDLTPQSVITELTISPTSNNGTIMSFGQPHNGQPITPISQTGPNGSSFHISLISMHGFNTDHSEITEEEKSVSPDVERR